MDKPQHILGYAAAAVIATTSPGLTTNNCEPGYLYARDIIDIVSQTEPVSFSVRDGSPLYRGTVNVPKLDRELLISYRPRPEDTPVQFEMLTIYTHWEHQPDLSDLREFLNRDKYDAMIEEGCVFHVLDPDIAEVRGSKLLQIVGAALRDNGFARHADRD